MNESAPIQREEESHVIRNPDNLSDAQVGVDEGWRLLEKDELNTVLAYPKNNEMIEEWNGEAWDVMSTLVHDIYATYRTKRPKGKAS